jgi:hypothetical protein
MSFPRLSLGNVLPGREINAEDWLAISKRSDWLYSSQAEIIPGHILPVSYQLTSGSSSYTQLVNQGQPLLKWAPIIVRHRSRLTSFNSFVYGVRYDWRTSRYSFTASLFSAIATATNVNSTSTGGWTVSTISVNPSITVVQAFSAEWRPTNPGTFTAEVTEFCILGRFGLV